MFQRRAIAILLIVAFFLLPACAAKTQKLKKQSEAIRNLGEAYLGQNNITAAIKQFLEAEKLYPDDYLLQDDLGMAYAAKKRYSKAIVHFKRAIKLQPDYAPAKNNLGSVYLLTKRWDEAIAVLNQVSDDILYASPHFPLHNTGWAYYNKGDQAKARHYFNRALELEPDFVFPMRGMALSFLAQGRLSDAIVWFEKAVTKAPQFQDLLYEMAGAYLKARQYDKARETLERAVAAGPDTKTGQKARRELTALSM